VQARASHPFASEASRLSQPVSQLAIRQTPVVHVAVAWARVHATPHEPQFVSVFVAVSHPSAEVALQSANRALQLPMAHVPVAQLGVAFGRVQATPHAPQSVSVLVAVSQPSDAVESQSPQPESQLAMLHVPPVHAGRPCAAVQARMHEPQNRGLVAVSVQTEPQRSGAVGGQSLTHIASPAMTEQSESAPVQLAPHAPHASEVEREVSHPLGADPSQSPNPELQRLTVHAPAAHPAVAFARSHRLLHEPQ